MDGYCNRCAGLGLIALGFLVFVNLLLLKWNWWVVAGTALVLAGFVTIVKPRCGCGRGCSIGPLPKDVDARIAAQEKTQQKAVVLNVKRR